MIQCTECEFCEISEDGRKAFKCDPFSNIKEPECLQKMQIMRLDMLATTYRSMLYWQEKMGPMQNKLFKYVQREIDDIDESDSWKNQEDLGDDPKDELADGLP